MLNGILSVCAITPAAAVAAEPVYVFSHIAGARAGSADGFTHAARFAEPQGTAIDSVGNLYVADTRNHTIRKITPAGQVVTIAGRAGSPGAVDGTGPAARFSGPRGLAVDAAGNVFVADSGNALIRMVTPSGEVSTLAGRVEGFGDSDGNRLMARFHTPADVALDGQGNFYVADEGNHTICRITPERNIVTLAGKAGASGGDNGQGQTARFNRPSGIALDWRGNLYVADAGNFTIRKITASGEVTTLAGIMGRRGTRDSGSGTAEFNFPRDVIVDSTGTLYVTDHHAVRKITPTGWVTTLSGVLWSLAGGFEDGFGSAARFASPHSLTIDWHGNLLVADSDNHAIRRVSPEGTVTTLAGPDQAALHRGIDGLLSEATFGLPQGIALTADGSLLVADFDYRDCKIRKIGAGGKVTSLFQATQPEGIAVDASGHAYVADWGASVIRRISPAGEMVIIAGTEWAPGDVDGVGSAARFRSLSDVTVDLDGNLLVTAGAVVRRITPSGLVSTLTGSYQTQGHADGSLANARFRTLQGIAVGPDGSIYLADWANCVVRKISFKAAAGAAVSTLAGSPGSYGVVDGLGANARLDFPRGIAVDARGNVFVTDDGNTIRKITPSGLVKTIGGQANVYGDRDGAGTNATFASPQDIVVDAQGILYIADTGNGAIRKGVPIIPPAFTVQPQGQAIGQWGWIRLRAEVSGDALGFQWLRNGREVTGATNPSLLIGDLQPMSAGLYVLRAENPAGRLDSDAAAVGISSTVKVVGGGKELTPQNVRHPNGTLFDQVRLTGSAVTVTADGGQVTRISFVDLDDDIVQVEFSGAGSLSLVLDEPSGPALPLNYTQNEYYKKGHAGIVIVGADESTNVGVFTVGQATAFDPTGAWDPTKPVSATNQPRNNGNPIFKGRVASDYDGIADIAFIAIVSPTGRFGGVRTANASFFASRGHTGIYAPGVAFAGPVYVGDLSAFDDAKPVLVLGSAGDVRITGGDLLQDNGQSVLVSGIAQLKFTTGTDSHGKELSVQTNRAVLEQDGVDVTAEIVVYP